MGGVVNIILILAGYGRVCFQMQCRINGKALCGLILPLTLCGLFKHTHCLKLQIVATLESTGITGRMVRNWFRHLSSAFDT